MFLNILDYWRVYRLPNNTVEESSRYLPASAIQAPFLSFLLRIIVESHRSKTKQISVCMYHMYSMYGIGRKFICVDGWTKASS